MCAGLLLKPGLMRDATYNDFYVASLIDYTRIVIPVRAMNYLGTFDELSSSKTYRLPATVKPTCRAITLFSSTITYLRLIALGAFRAGPPDTLETAVCQLFNIHSFIKQRM
jgi:hypothetical protein